MFNLVLKKQNISYYSFFVVFVILLYPIIVFDSINKTNPVNFMIYIVSFIVFLYAVYSIKEKNINSHNIFLFGFFIALFLNTLNASTKQLEKELIDMYYYFFGPLLVASMLYLFESLKIKKVSFRNIIKLDVNSVYIFLVIFYIIIKSYIGYQVGFRLFEYDAFATGDKYVIPGWSGISAMLQWSLLIFLPFVKKKYAIIAVLSIIVFSGILHVKRGDIVRVFVFLMIYYSFLKIYLHQLNFQFISKIILAVIILITVFSVFGEYRLEARGAGSGIILEYLGSKVDSVAFAWLYGYMTFNFEIIKLYFEMTPLYEFNTFKELVAPTGEDKYIGVGISGFNAATFLRYYIIDFGIFYFVGLFFYALIVGLLVVIAKKIRFIGLEIFIFTLLFLNLFGDYLILRSVFMSIIFSLLLFPFLKLEKNKFLQGIK